VLVDRHDLPRSRRVDLGGRSRSCRRWLLGEAARQALQPPLRSAAEKRTRGLPEEVITGPVSRGDVGTVARHLEALAAHGAGEVLAAFRVLARAALALSRDKLPPETAARLAATLER
jgi:predicted short-subunit dehydrogenase-like oxidoreductase (DUF2520 family)